MKKSIIHNYKVYIMILLLPLLFACSQNNTEDEKDDIKCDFTFIIISDLQTRIPGFPDDPWYDSRGNIKNIEKTIKLINKSEKDSSFLVVTGDLVGCLFSENPDDYGIGILNPAEKMLSLMGELQLPWYPVLGNHDYQKGFDTVRGEGITTDNQEAIEAVWNKLLNIPPYYSEIYKGVNLIFLNSCRGDANILSCVSKEVERICTGSFDSEQLEWLASELEKEEPAILFCHHPPETDDPLVMWSFSSMFTIQDGDNFYDITYQYRNKIMGIFAGHGHLFQKDMLHEIIPVCETGSLGDKLAEPERYTKVYVDLVSGSLQFVWIE